MNISQRRQKLRMTSELLCVEGGKHEFECCVYFWFRCTKCQQMMPRGELERLLND